MQKITAVLVGQPNVGKSSLLNAISGSNFKVGNFSGVTISKSQATFIYKDIELKAYLEQADFHDVQIHKKKSWLCITARK